MTLTQKTMQHVEATVVRSMRRRLTRIFEKQGFEVVAFFNQKTQKGRSIRFSLDADPRTRAEQEDLLTKIENFLYAAYRGIYRECSIATTRYRRELSFIVRLRRMTPAGSFFDQPDEFIDGEEVTPEEPAPFKKMRIVRPLATVLKELPDKI